MTFLCIGSAHWDLIGRTSAPLPPAADVPGRIGRYPGGVAQNVARALAGLGRPVRLVAAVGIDRDGELLANELAAAGVDTEWLYRAGKTDRYLAIEDARGALHAAVADCAGLERAGLDLLAPLRTAGAWRGLVLVDGNLPAPVLAEILSGQSPVAFVPASPRKIAALAPLVLAHHARLYLNRAEAEALCGRRFPDSRSAAQAVWAHGAAEAVVTDGAAPATATAGTGLVTLPAPAAVAHSVTGAGDAFVAAHLAARTDGRDPESALALALEAARRRVTAGAP